MTALDGDEYSSSGREERDLGRKDLKVAQEEGAQTGQHLDSSLQGQGSTWLVEDFCR